MRRRGWTSRWPGRLLASSVGGMVLLAGTLTAHAQARPGPVTGWVRHFAAPLTTVDPAAPLGDLTPLRRAIGDAEVVGLGESTHGVAEEETLKHRTPVGQAEAQAPADRQHVTSDGEAEAGERGPCDGSGVGMAGSHDTSLSARLARSRCNS